MVLFGKRKSAFLHHERFLSRRSSGTAKVKAQAIRLRFYSAFAFCKIIQSVQFLTI
ncbi:hypothetical protein CLOLEP_03698 [[Clostridium] leptum DSM 753]|uniref:Uncharacterized protein n=1 Tax=[Clostridium] leptum DSM 753 TaxID=428125 RepID=A7VYM0_9FIRM|nr:hypothetical protein CLOLEP_03698 [[Clostridium] leptum DSM 753]